MIIHANIDPIVCISPAWDQASFSQLHRQISNIWDHCLLKQNKKTPKTQRKAMTINACHNSVFFIYIILGFGAAPRVIQCEARCFNFSHLKRTFA